jgi:hypothetical protein
MPPAAAEPRMIPGKGFVTIYVGEIISRELVH